MDFSFPVGTASAAETERKRRCKKAVADHGGEVTHEYTLIPGFRYYLPHRRRPVAEMTELTRMHTALRCHRVRFAFWNRWSMSMSSRTSRLRPSKRLLRRGVREDGAGKCQIWHLISRA